MYFSRNGWDIQRELYLKEAFYLAATWILGEMANCMVPFVKKRPFLASKEAAVCK